MGESIYFKMVEDVQGCIYKLNIAHIETFSKIDHWD